VTTSARWWVGSSEIAPENDQKTFGSLNLLAVTSCGYALSDSIGEEGLEPITFVELCSLDLLNLLAVTSCGYALSDSIGEEGLEPITFVELVRLLGMPLYPYHASCSTRLVGEICAFRDSTCWKYLGLCSRELREGIAQDVILMRLS
jgi:cellobiose-specific phosphotransferase system component IIC